MDAASIAHPSRHTHTRTYGHRRTLRCRRVTLRRRELYRAMPTQSQAGGCASRSSTAISGTAVHPSLAGRALRGFSGGAGPEDKRLKGMRQKTMNFTMVSRGHCAAAL
jgi:hypothetical protein